VAVGTLLAAHGVLLLRGLRGADDLRVAASGLGTPVVPGVSLPAAAVGDAADVYEVKRRGAGLRDDHRNVITSTTAERFPLHTDGYNLTRPPRFVLLLRIDASAEAAASTVSDARAALCELTPETRARLWRPAFPSARGPVALVEREGSLDRVRCNPQEAARWHAGEDLSAMTALTAAMDAAVARLTLARGECLLLDNWRVCHGRDDLSSDSDRVLLRMWVDAPAPRG
jgi:alpha-ketoglutarate-dependent taurine dioxygenase